MRDTVARVRRLLEEATTAKQDAAAPDQPAAFTTPGSTNALRNYVEQSPRARKKREIHRIASWYGWGSEIDRALDAAGASSAARLTDDQLDQLLARMRQLEDCVQNATDCPDAPPAR